MNDRRGRGGLEIRFDGGSWRLMLEKDERDERDLIKRRVRRNVSTLLFELELLYGGLRGGVFVRYLK